MSSTETNSKESQDLVISIKKTEKDLDFTKIPYEQLAGELKDELDKETNKHTKSYQELYGMYYCAVIGLLRSGALCSRFSGVDGFPMLRVYGNHRDFECRENIVYSILKPEEADDLIKPYKDDSNSYIQSFTRLVTPTISGTPLENNEKSAKTRVATNAVTHNSDSADRVVGAAQDTAKNKNGEPGTAAKMIAGLTGLAAGISNTASTAKTNSETESLKKEIERLKKEKEELSDKCNSIIYNSTAASTGDSDALRQLKEQISVSEVNVAALRKELEEWKAKYKVADNQNIKLVQKMKAAEEEQKKYVYDPNYDHYYSDELPVILDDLEFKKTGIMVRTGAIIACGLGFIGCLVALV